MEVTNMNKYEFTFEFENKEITCTTYNNTRSQKELERNIVNYIIEEYGFNFKLLSIKPID
jgi:hypothetical protein